MDIRSTLRKFINENFLISEKDNTLEDSSSFLETGVVDSTGILEIVEFLEEKFEITIEDEELVPEYLDSIENLTNFLNKKLEGGENNQWAM